ncbi:signal transduction histidine kinase [Pseudomonas sp. SJZ103]|uniref:GAF domain-containing sensor histidine kinase n=1 Tax=unclassified Pseudomonas TaxID=196821 RepID=UPI00104076D9|nr:MULTISPECIES: GAF domain-containing sensor histidine kinase [unclassified Pseudomonas]MBB6285636.1 signal transduction histidine kinase [Pseudomonas sp. SJZ073]MBB6312439.1 signal transduction histidine kinase [Pseudomonas sp. JAI120]MCS4311987.1 signal transduction histidine kinase [Pseudomonas sp. BIGb0381]NJJ56287.1 GAF domain-containing sensor histidine kinase [Pseudomonas sp. B14(2022)]TWC63857.1 signal transduction histidine kinase [Pseudomonas sp. SJZ103]
MGQKAADIATIGRISAVHAMLQVISDMTGLRFAAVARVTDDTWTACAVLDQLDFGLGIGGELDLTTTICHEIRSSHVSVVIDKASEDPLYHDHHTPRLYHFESYISVPVFRTDGRFFGTICALDPNPAVLRSSTIQSTMESFARVLSLQIEAEEAAQQTQAQLQEERGTAELREQFIAVLGHDLRNPLFAINVAAERLLRKHADPATDTLVRHILTSGRRAAQLVEDVLDFARGRMGTGIPLNIGDCQGLQAALQHVVSEVQSVHPQRVIRADIGDLQGVSGDRDRLAQLLSNLVANAIHHGNHDGPVEVHAQVEQGRFHLSVKNPGQINAQALPRLFEPYSRPATNTPQTGLGLGLYIVKQIAEAHGGELNVSTSAEHGTVFTFSLPTG